MIDSIAVIGSGAWAMGIASQLTSHDVVIWTHQPRIAEGINRNHQNPVYMPEWVLGPHICATTNLADTSHCDVIILAVSSAHVGIAKQLTGRPLLSVAKGFVSTNDRSQLRFISQTLASYGCGPIAVMSGPNLAAEVMAGRPTATVIASEDDDTAQRFQQLLSTHTIRAYRSADVKGVECGGVLKNSYAIAAGILDACEGGYNAKAALLTRAIEEMSRLTCHLGGTKDTLMGLSGYGDLIATCHAPTSRNYRLGYAFVANPSIEHATRTLGHAVAEGVRTTKCVYDYACHHHIDMPIIEVLYHVLYAGLPIQEGIRQLMERPLQVE